MLWLKAFHIVGVVTWFAGMFYLPRLFVYHAAATDPIGIAPTLVAGRFVTDTVFSACDGVTCSYPESPEDDAPSTVDLNPFQRSGVDQPAHHRLADLGVGRKLAHRALPPFDPSQCLLALRGQPGRRNACRPILDHLPRPGQCGRSR